MKVSVITPTRGRSQHLSTLLQTFAAQSHADKELLIFDDSAQPDEHVLSVCSTDPTIRYFHSPHPISTGMKRNRLIDESTGDVIMHFDDDDFYAPGYIERMLELLGEKDFFTLSGWFAWSVADRMFTYWDTGVTGVIHYMLTPRATCKVVKGETLREAMSRNMWGYGFSYVYRKAVHAHARFPDRYHSEDILFVQDVMRASLEVGARPDTDGLVLHMLHTDNASGIFPQFVLPAFMMPQLFPGAERVVRLAGIAQAS